MDIYILSRIGAVGIFAGCSIVYAMERTTSTPMHRLVPDDCNTPSCWTEQQADTWAGFTKTIYLRKKLSYCPPTVHDQRLINWIVLHGTFGHETKDYFDDQSLENQNFRHIKRAASLYATRAAKRLELLSFAWNNYRDSHVPGGLSDTDRIVASEVIHKFLQWKKYDEESELIILSHSHGCNVANMISRLLSADHPIELLIYFACPRRYEEEYQPLHYKKLIYFFSDADLMTILGRLSENKIRESIVSLGRASGLSKIVSPAAASSDTVYSTMSPSADEQQYSSIKNITSAMSKAAQSIPLASGNMIDVCRAADSIIDVLDEFKKPAPPTAASFLQRLLLPNRIEQLLKAGTAVQKALLFSPGTGQPLDKVEAVQTVSVTTASAHGTNEFKEIERPDNATKSIIGLRTQINGSSPGHSDIVNAVQYLDDIRNHIAVHHNDQNNTIFDLRIDESLSSGFDIKIQKQDVSSSEH